MMGIRHNNGSTSIDIKFVSNFKKLVFCVFFWGGLITGSVKGQVTGIVVDTTFSPLPNVEIFNQAGLLLGKTKNDGIFQINKIRGYQKIIFLHPDFHSLEIPLSITEKKDTFNIRLISKTESISEVFISKIFKDMGPEYMRKAIAKQAYWNSRIPNLRAHVYIKAFEISDTKKKRLPDSSDKYVDTSTINGKAFVEISMTLDASAEGKIKEVREGITKIGNKSGLFYLSTSEGDFNLYQNLLQVPTLCALPIMSPLSNSALLAYKFGYINSYQDSQYGRIIRIKMTARQTSNATFNGEIHLVDSGFWVYKAILKFPKHLMAEYDEMTLEQFNRLDSNNNLLIDSQRFKYKKRLGRSNTSAFTKVDYTNVEIIPAFPKNHFGLEISKTSKEAYQRDSSYWANTRKQALSIQETQFISKNDSLQRVRNSNAYLDSIEKLINHVTWKNLLLLGQGYENRSKGLKMDFNPLISVFNPLFPGGMRICLYSSLSKTYENKKEIKFFENLNYGINNKDLLGTVSAYHKYNPYKNASIRVSMGRDLGWINPNAAVLDVLRRDNFYLKKYATVDHAQELFNGLFLRVMGEYTNRKDLSAYQFDKLGDSLYENNKPALFSENRSFFSTLTLSYTPFQRYLSEPKQKIILESTWPKFSVVYKQAIPRFLGSTIHFTYLEYRIEQKFIWGLLGKSELRAISGSFLNRNSLTPIDYKYHRRGDKGWLTNPMVNFQQLDSTFITFNRFYSLHFQHHFNGSLLNKLPLLKQLSLYETIGLNLLLAPERRNLFYYEIYGGVDKQVKIWRNTYKIGLYYTVGYANIYTKPLYGFKINFEIYNPYKNSW